MSGEPPPYRKHESAIDRMSPEERLRSLQEYAEKQKYVKPGDSGTLATNAGGVAGLVFGGRMVGSGYDKPLPPPEYGRSENELPKERRKSAVGRWIDRRRSSKADASATAQASQDNRAGPSTRPS